MATIALPRPIAPHRSSSDIVPLSPPLSLDELNSSQQPLYPANPVPNKHIPTCPTGPPSSQEPDVTSDSSENVSRLTSLLYPPDQYNRLELGSQSIFSIDAANVAAALDYVSRQPLPDPGQVFPWFHGLHPHNQIQQAFFVARRKTIRKTPDCFRGITVVKADGDLSVARLKGAISPDEFLLPDSPGEFIDIDPREGFSVRNFQIQPAKTAMVSDIIVYGEDDTQVRSLGWQIAAAQSSWREKHRLQGHEVPLYNTFICLSPFGEFEARHREIVSVDSRGHLTGEVVDFSHQERMEMYTMTMASEISHNVWMGPTPEPGSEDELDFDVLIECSDLARLNPAQLRVIAENPHDDARFPDLDFPSSGSILPPTWSHAEADAILETCKWIWHISHGISSARNDIDFDGDSQISDESDTTPDIGRTRRILIHCPDGYTETTMLCIAYYSYSTGRPIPEAWLSLHTTMQRNFFAYPTDVALLTSIAARLLHESPACMNKGLSEIASLIKNEPKWMANLDGSLPSRVLDYMYLGNLGHANNPELLKAMGICQVLSVGEQAMWREGELDDWGHGNVYFVQGVQDNGIDPLMAEFQKCLDFIDRGRRNGTATLVHCRVGVSRSATICIAEVMRTLNMSFPRAYCFVRARRLNVIIQPHLRFAYELLKWEEYLQTQNEDGSPSDMGQLQRELEWGEIAREIALMNKPYTR